MKPQGGGDKCLENKEKNCVSWYKNGHLEFAVWIQIDKCDAHVSNPRARLHTLLDRLLNSHLSSAWATKQFCAMKWAKWCFHSAKACPYLYCLFPTLPKCFWLKKGKLIYIMLLIDFLCCFKDMQKNLKVYK